MGKLIDVEDAYKFLTEFYHHTTEVQYKALKEALDRVPEAEPEIVHCKTCVYITCKGCAHCVTIGGKVFCRHWGKITAEDAFCSFSKRKEKDATD